MRAVHAVVAALLGVACSREQPCPAGTATDEARTGRLRGLLARDAEGAAVVARASDRVGVCHGDGVEVGLVEGRVALLDRRDPEPVAAARLAHLLVHAMDGDPMEGTDACEARLARARERETKAHELEVRIRARLGAAALPGDALEKVMEAYGQRCRAGGSGQMR